MKSCIIADDHPITLQGLKIFVESLGYCVLETFENGLDAYQGVVHFKPDFLISDLSMPRMTGLELLEKIRSEKIDIKVVLYTMYREKIFLDRAKDLGVNGYLLKDFATEELEVCLKKIGDDKFWFSHKLDENLVESKLDTNLSNFSALTAAEQKILKLIGEDYNTKTIAELLFISEKTVEKHRSNIIRKLELPNEKNILQRFASQNSFIQNISSKME